MKEADCEKARQQPASASTGSPRGVPVSYLLVVVLVGRASRTEFVLGGRQPQAEIEWAARFRLLVTLYLSLPVSKWHPITPKS